MYLIKNLYNFLKYLVKTPLFFDLISSNMLNVKLGKSAVVSAPARVTDVEIGDYSYIAPYSIISSTTFGKFCSVGPNLLCGWGIHPLNGFSTSPLFYSKKTPFGFSWSKNNKITERLPIIIENDVFIGSNVTILDGVTIGNGAVIAAGAVVVKNVPPYAIVGGVPAKIIKYRFSETIIKQLLEVAWWDKDVKLLEKLSAEFFDMKSFFESLVDKDK